MNEDFRLEVSGIGRLVFSTIRTPLWLFLVLAACGNDSGHSAAHVATAAQTANVGPLHPYCAQCHAPPSPRLHKRDEWPVVVRRMEHHRLDARMPRIPDDARRKVVAWLQEHAQF